jgi:hypothetical protein
LSHPEAVTKHRARAVTTAAEWGGLKRMWAKALTPARPTTTRRPTASAFANWVFDQTVTRKEGTCSAQALERATWKKRLALGVATHQDIELFRMHCWTQAHLKNVAHSEWKLFFADNQSRSNRPFIASRLKVDGVPVRCIPDVVVHRPIDSTFIIIERKTTTVPEPFIPAQGWPNVEAQLWCYSWMDDFRSAARVILVSQIWQRTRGGLSLCHEHAYWQRGSDVHEKRCEAWFRRYGGSISSALTTGLANPGTSSRLLPSKMSKNSISSD